MESPEELTFVWEGYLLTMQRNTSEVTSTRSFVESLAQSLEWIAAPKMQLKTRLD